MFGPRCKKIAGDIALCQGRLVMMTVAIAIGIFVVTAISTADSILGRELNLQYLSTNPASALLEVDHLGEAAVGGVRLQPGIAWAELGGRLSGRVEVGNGAWLPLLLFVVPDFAAQRIATVRLTAGRWPGAGDIVLERTALAVANSDVGRELTVRTPNGPTRTLHVVGAVHDASLAPAWQQQTVYGYVTPATLRLLGEDTELGVLKLTVNDPDANPAQMERTVVNAVTWLQREGHAVREIRIPPRHHPHQSQMTSVIRMLLVFGVLTLALSAILTATLTAGLLAPHVRQIAVMKSIGATTAQVTVLYMALVAAVGIFAAGVGLPCGVAGGRALAANVARMLNLELSSLSVPLWTLVTLALAGVGLPLLLALYPIVNATRRTVREALNDFGAAPESRAGKLARWTSRMTMRDPALALAIRNSVRRRVRLALNVALLATAGAVFVTALNTKASWDQNLIDAGAERHYDVQLQFAQPADAAAAVAVALSVPGVRSAEAFGDEPAALARRDGLDIVRTFPDGGHGSLRINSLPWNSSFVSPVVIEGQWLGRNDAVGAVLNSQALAFFPALKIGDPIRIIARGRPVTLTFEGVVREHLAGATIYTSSNIHAHVLSEPGTTAGIRIGLEREEREFATRTTAAIGRALEDAGFKVAQTISRAQLHLALAGHQFILIFILIVMAVLMAIVGLLGLGAAMAIGVLERAREFAVLRAIGAGNAAILRTVIAEGVLVGMASVVPAALLSAPLSVAVASVVGASTAGPGLYVASAAALPLWLAMILVGAAAASAFPAWRASKLTIREALIYQ